MKKNPSFENSSAWKRAVIDRLDGNYVFTDHLEEIQSEIDRYLPKFLYRYRSASNVNHVASLLAGEEWMASPLTFNDPYDSGFAINFERLEASIMTPDAIEVIWQKQNLDAEFDSKTKQEILSSPKPLDALMRALLAQSPLHQTNKDQIVEEVWRRQQEAMRDEMRDSVRICCFSEDATSILMWSHYADYHRGFVIEYDIEAFSADQRTAFFPVDYRDGLPDTDGVFLNRTKANLFWRVAAACMKAIYWRYEREWRLITWNTAFSGKFEGSAHPIQMPKPARVLLGAKIEPRNQRLIEHICKARGIHCPPMKLEPGGFQIDTAS
ncbi:DUF2971 domain-containing protein [Prosthecobacter sp.]|uniref:DUF2971 domain-containing protein n=1 Tax=Prosthecobacter sp. TaxID=1965333 RepID=UPI002ABC05DC|nr:DUF2971 domain-containing protein [Prosthecobacter sp.]MDZ4402999.1 DUF2971 domain-containing protein [Prosthecobacter sp.]